MKKYLNFKTLVILLIIGLIGSNISLQIKVEEAIKAANDAEFQATKAFRVSETATRYASDAADYAEEASNNALDAYYSAQEAASYSFGRQCWSCP